MEFEITRGTEIFVEKSAWHKALNKFYKERGIVLNRDRFLIEEAYSDFLWLSGLLEYKFDSEFDEPSNEFCFFVRNPEKYFLAKINYGI